MRVEVKILIEKSCFDDWYEFYKSYELRRKKFIADEQIQKISEQEARVSFEIIDLSGLTELSSEAFIREKENDLGVVVSII